MSKHYDVVVLGTSIGALTAAALLARRSWRVLVLGHGHRPAAYRYGDVELSRRPFTLLSHASPAWGRVLAELAQSQTFRRRISPLDPRLQILGPRLRLDVPCDQTLFGKEIQREFPEVRRVVDDFYADLERTNAAADAAFEKDVVWPPGTFWERRETGRALSTLPHVREESAEFLAEFPRDHGYRAVIDAPVRFASYAEEVPPFAAARLHGAWTRGTVELGGGEDELTEFLVERVRAHGGEARLGDRAVAIEQRGGKVTGIRIDGDAAPSGVQFVVSDTTTHELLALVEGFAASRRALAVVPALVPSAHRFVLSAWVKTRGLPPLLSAESFLLPCSPLTARNPKRPAVHLRCARRGERSLLVAEVLLDDEALPLERAREAVLSTLEQFLPFVERHYLVVDSPNDGRPLWDYRSGARKLIDRVALRPGGGSAEIEPMAPTWRVEEPTLFGLAAEPLRTPLANAFVVGRSVLPALGQEGQLLSAWSAARIITRTDRRKEKMRRDMWTKVEVA